MRNEDLLRKKLKWQSINEIPNLPFNNFEQFQNALREGSHQIIVSYPAVTNFHSLINSPVSLLINFVLVMSQYAIPLLLLVVALIYSKYLLLLWIPVPFLSFSLGHPINPTRIIMTILNLVILIIGAVSYYFEYTSITWLCIAFVIPFIACRLFYKINVHRLVKSASLSEPLFLFLYGIFELIVMDKKNRKSLWARDIVDSTESKVTMNESVVQKRIDEKQNSLLEAMEIAFKTKDLPREQQTEAMRKFLRKKKKANDKNN